MVYRFLTMRRVLPALVIGVRRDEGRVAAHAWVLVDGQPVGESAASLSEFAPVITFSELDSATGVPSSAS